MLIICLRPLFILKENPSIAYGLTLIVAFVICWLSLSPLAALPPAPGSDKLHHLIAYGGLAFPLSFISAPYLARYLIGFLVLGGLIEVVQPFVNRYGEIADFGANCAGVCLGYVGARAVAIMLKDVAPKNRF